MKDTEEAVKGLKMMMRGIANRSNIIAGQVASVDESAMTIDVLVDGLTYPDVRLAAYNEKPEGASFIIPVVNSWILFGFVNGSETDAFVLMFTEYEKIITRATKIIYNDGQNEGLVKVVELTDRLNTIEKAFNTLLNHYKTHIHSGGVLSGGSTGTSVPPVTQQKLQETDKKDIQNENITH